MGLQREIDQVVPLVPVWVWVGVVSVSRVQLIGLETEGSSPISELDRELFVWYCSP